MIPDPLHPAIVHLPLALALLMPAFAAWGWLAVRRQWIARRGFSVVLLLQLLLVGSAWLALETGEEQEERVEAVVTEAPLDRHEEAAERFLWLAAAVVPLAAAGLLGGRAGEVARAASAVAALGVLVAGVAVGHSGGQLVYRYGAASAYTTRAPAAGGGLAHDVSRRDHRD